MRGKKLIKILEDAIRQLSEKAAESNKKYSFNASELQRVTGVSRVTIAKYEEEIEQILEDVKASARVRYGQAHLQALLNQIDNLSKDIKELAKDNHALRKHHAEIYKRLYSHSVDISGLIKPEVINEIESKGKCILCGTKISNSRVRKKSNVVSIDSNRP